MKFRIDVIGVVSHRSNACGKFFYLAQLQKHVYSKRKIHDLFSGQSETIFWDKRQEDFIVHNNFPTTQSENKPIGSATEELGLPCFISLVGGI